MPSYYCYYQDVAILLPSSYPPPPSPSFFSLLFSSPFLGGGGGVWHVCALRFLFTDFGGQVSSYFIACGLVTGVSIGY